MSGGISDNRSRWLVLGLVAGLGISYFWPHEPTYAATDRAAQFAITTCPVGGLVGISAAFDGIFTLDFLTGDLKGAVLNLQQGKFNTFYYRNLAKDLELDPKTEAKYAFITGSGQLSGRGGVTLASGVI